MEKTRTRLGHDSKSRTVEQTQGQGTYLSPQDGAASEPRNLSVDHLACLGIDRLIDQLICLGAASELVSLGGKKTKTKLGQDSDKTWTRLHYIRQGSIT